MNSLYCGNCLYVLPTISEQVDMILCDLPYGTTQCSWDSVINTDLLWHQYKRLIKPNGAIVLFGSQPFTSALVMSNPEWFRYCWVWHKHRSTGFLDAKRRPLKEHEDIVVFYQSQPTYNPQMAKGGKHSRGSKTTGPANVYGDFSERKVTESDEFYPSSVLSFSCVATPVHPTEKPVSLLEYLILTYTNTGETVLDNTMGSGSTGVACVKTQRHFIGIEQDTTYFAIAEKRIIEASHQGCMEL